MKYSKILSDAIASKNIKGIKAALITAVDNDRNLSCPIASHLAKEVGEELLKSNISIFETDNRNLVLPPKEEWSRKTWDVVKSSMQFNFSFEKFPLAEEILTTLREKGIKEMMPIDNSRSNEPVDNEPVDNEPVDNEPVDKKPVDKKPVDKKTVGGGSIGTEGKTHPKSPVQHRKYSSRVDIIDGAILVGGVVVGAIVAGIGAGLIVGLVGVTMLGKKIIEK